MTFHLANASSDGTDEMRLTAAFTVDVTGCCDGHDISSIAFTIRYMRI